MAAQVQDGVPQDRDGPRGQTLYQGHSFKIEGEEYGFFPVDITPAWMALFPTYEVSGPELHVRGLAGNDLLARTVALLHQERSSSEAQARVA
jgi:hypothetical protein